METSPVRPHAARVALMRSFLVFAAGTTAGGLWDFEWHAKNAFESFVSPPHLLVYSSAAAAAVMLALLVRDPTMRCAFVGDRTGGQPLGLSRLRGLDPGLRFLGAGVAVVFLSGALDLAWHTAFGVDETRWSAPHAMFGWGLLSASLGWWCARLRLVGAPAVSAAERLVLSFFVLSYAYYAVLLPYAVYPTQEAVAAIAGLDAVRASPGSDHTFRIYAEVGVSHLTVPSLVLGSAWAGLAAGWLRGLGAGARVSLAAAATFTVVSVALGFGMASILGIAPDWTFLWPAPILAFVVAHAVCQRRIGPGATELCAAVAFVMLALLPWLATAPPSGLSAAMWLAAAAAASTAVGVVSLRSGGWMGERIKRAQPGDWFPLALGLGVLPPALYGALDLYLRINVP